MSSKNSAMVVLLLNYIFFKKYLKASSYRQLCLRSLLYNWFDFPSMEILWYGNTSLSALSLKNSTIAHMLFLGMFMLIFLMVSAFAHEILCVTCSKIRYLPAANVLVILFELLQFVLLEHLYLLVQL